ELVAKESPKAIFAPVTSRMREFVARLAARLGAGLSADSVALAMEGDALVDAPRLRRQAPREDDVGEDAVDRHPAPERLQARRERGRQERAGGEAEREDPRREDEAGRAARGGLDGPARADRGRDRHLRWARHER